MNKCIINKKRAPKFIAAGIRHIVDAEDQTTARLWTLLFVIGAKVEYIEFDLNDSLCSLPVVSPQIAATHAS